MVWQTHANLKLYATYISMCWPKILPNVSCDSQASQTLTMELTDGDIRVDKTGTLIFSDTETLDADMLFVSFH